VSHRSTESVENHVENTALQRCNGDLFVKKNELHHAW